jgi:predicted XRE-type DNA-binding protein
MMTDQIFTSAWDAIEDTPAQAETMKLRSLLMMAISEHIKSNGLSQTQAAKLFGVTQPRISDLIRGKINLFSIDTLIAMLSSAGLQIELKIHRTTARTVKTGSKAIVQRRVSRVAKPTRQRSAA